MYYSNKYILASLFLVTVLVVWLIWKVERNKTPLSSKEKCLDCHKQVTDPSKSHPVEAFGCYQCHLGNPYSTDKASAHYGMIRNPGDLEIVAKTCGKAKCHPEQVQRISRSLMATNRGIIGTLLERWENRDNPDIDVLYIKTNGTGKSLALDLYVKMCAGCHLWQKREPHKGWPKNRGGGCSACHTVGKFNKLEKNNTKYNHPRISTIIPVENCLRCHNRSARMGLSYLGIYESSGYGTPFHGSSPSEKRLTGRRFYMNLPADVHWKKHQLLCIDCHTGKGLMGDGNRYNHFEEQVEITCEACHLPQFRLIDDTDAAARKLASSNGKIMLPKNISIAHAKKNSPLYNLQRKNKSINFFMKKSGKEIKFTPLDTTRAYHNLRGHERLRCQACHSRWIPQCYGCHYIYTKSEKQKDWIWGKKSLGRWKEFRYFIRFENPTLGVDFDNTIMPFSPCQVLVRTRKTASDRPVPTGTKHMIMSAFDPHTTLKESRSCIDCHRNPKTLGLGEGTLTRKTGKWTFSSVFDTSVQAFFFEHPLDSFVSLGGTALQKGYRPGARPFSEKELEKILRVSLCLGCHRNYEDKIYRDFEKSYQQFQNNAVPCNGLGENQKAIGNPEMGKSSREFKKWK